MTVFYTSIEITVINNILLFSDLLAFEYYEYEFIYNFLKKM